MKSRLDTSNRFNFERRIDQILSVQFGSCTITIFTSPTWVFYLKVFYIGSFWCLLLCCSLSFSPVLYHDWLGQHGLCCNTNTSPSFLNTWSSFSCSLKPSKAWLTVWKAWLCVLKQLLDGVFHYLKRIYENLLYKKHTTLFGVLRN